MRIIVTGGSGAVAARIRPLLVERGHRVVLFDTSSPRDPLRDGEELVLGSVTDAAAVERVAAASDLVVHLAAFPVERPWERMVELNITGTRTVLEAARTAGLQRVMLASSIHAVGMLRVRDVRDVREPSPHPDTYYGVSKAAVEALGRLYGERFGMTVVSARIGTAIARPDSARCLSTWLSPADLVRLIEACGTSAAAGGHVVWAVSNNTRRVVSLEAGHVIGFHPLDDAEQYAEELGNPVPMPDDELLAGAFADDDHPVGAHW